MPVGPETHRPQARIAHQHTNTHNATCSIVVMHVKHTWRVQSVHGVSGPVCSGGETCAVLLLVCVCVCVCASLCAVQPTVRKPE